MSKKIVRTGLLLATLLFLVSVAQAAPKDFYAGADSVAKVHGGFRAEVVALPEMGGAGQAGSGHQVLLSWGASVSAAACTSPCVLGYTVLRGTATGLESVTLNTGLITGLTFTDPVTLTSNPQTFFYIVEAVETSGGITVNSVPSNEVSVTFPGTPAPPTGLVAKPN